MERRVIVSFEDGQVRALPVSAGECEALGADDARAWLLDAFDELGCEPINPMGKLLTVDLILGVARAAGAQRVDSDPQWANRFAVAASCLRSAPALHVDVAHCVLQEDEAP
jgi:hypothetical protein